VTLQIDPTLRLHVDSVASIESQGLTGATYVEIDGGTANSPLLQLEPGQDYAVIPSKPSTLQQLAQSGPELVANLKTAGERFSDLLNDENRKAVTELLTHLRATSAVLDEHAEDFDALLSNMRNATESLNRVLGSTDRAISNADRALDVVNTAAGAIQNASESANMTVQKVGKLSDDADKIVNSQATAQFTQLMAETRALVASLTKLSNDLERQPTRLLFGDQRQGYTPK
jgi:phospholipid/cholesterol/gamma-HCH transport system substrate-binding protein